MLACTKVTRFSLNTRLTFRFISCLFAWLNVHSLFAEHRNMQLADSLRLVSSNYLEYIRKQEENLEHEREIRGPYTGPVAAPRHLQFVLRMLADGRSVTMAEITDMIQYLSERRDQMTATFGGDRVPYKPSKHLKILQKINFRVTHLVGHWGLSYQAAWSTNVSCSNLQ